MITYLVILVLALLLTGFFAGIEVAFVTTNKLSIELKKKQGKRSGVLISELMEQPSRFIGMCLIGFHLFLVLYGLLVSHLLSPLLHLIAIDDEATNSVLALAIRAVIGVLLSSMLALLVEFVFKAIFKAKNDALLSFFASPAAFFFRLFEPVSRLLVGISTWILKYVFNVRMDDPRRPFSRIDLEHYFQQTKEVESENTELNKELFENALGLPGVRIRSCLVPRKEIVGVEQTASVDEARRKMIDTRLSKLLVYDQNIDNIVGYVHQLDLFKNPPTLQSILISIPAVPETMSVSDLMSKMTREGKSMAWVVDEFGGTAGIVTMEDLLEEIFGEIHDEYDTEEFVEKQLSATEYIFSGRLEIDYLQEKFGLHFEEAPSETLSGFVINHHEGIPKLGERIIIDDYQFEILNMADTRIELLKLKVLG